LRALLSEFNVPVDLKDEDGETALFVVETDDCAPILVEEFHADTNIRGEDNKTPGERIEGEDEFPEVAAYLKSLDFGSEIARGDGTNGIGGASSIIGQPPPLPEGVSIDVGTMAPEDAGEDVVDEEFKRRIEELAARGDFQGEDGQRELRQLITEALRGEVGDGRDVRQRTD
jgi:hypothetical protein